MRYIEFEKIAGTVESLCIAAGYELGGDVLAALRQAAQKETNPSAANILNQLIENARIAEAESIPLCQDTGLAVVFVEQGADAAVRPAVGEGDTTLFDAINTGVAAGYKNGFLRKSVVADPLNKRENTDSNTPAIIHHCIVPGDKLKLTVMAKGGAARTRAGSKCSSPRQIESR